MASSRLLRVCGCHLCRLGASSDPEAGWAVPHSDFAEAGGPSGVQGGPGREPEPPLLQEALLHVGPRWLWGSQVPTLGQGLWSCLGPAASPSAPSPSCTGVPGPTSHREAVSGPIFGATEVQASHCDQIPVWCHCWCGPPPRTAPPLPLSLLPAAQSPLEGDPLRAALTPGQSGPVLPSAGQSPCDSA